MNERGERRRVTFDDLIMPKAGAAPEETPDSGAASTVCKCGGQKSPRYETCFACSGMTLCASCGEKYHSADYDECYQCHRETVRAMGGFLRPC